MMILVIKTLAEAADSARKKVGASHTLANAYSVFFGIIDLFDLRSFKHIISRRILKQFTVLDHFFTCFLRLFETEFAHTRKFPLAPQLALRFLLQQTQREIPKGWVATSASDVSMRQRRQGTSFFLIHDS